MSAPGRSQALIAGARSAQGSAARGRARSGAAALRTPRAARLAPLALLAVGLAAASDCSALDVLAAQRLARQSGCTSCHGVYQAKDGPAWKDVAAKYHGEAGAAERLYRHLTTGRKARMADGSERDHPIVKTSDPARIRNLVDWILALPVAAPVDVAAAQTLARQNRCMKCHSVDERREAPSWKEVSAKYLGSVGAEDALRRHLTTGRKARFADGHEEPHPVVKTADPDRLANLVNWILSLR